MKREKNKKNININADVSIEQACLTVLYAIVVVIDRGGTLRGRNEERKQEFRVVSRQRFEKGADKCACACVCMCVCVWYTNNAWTTVQYVKNDYRHLIMYY